MKQEEKSRRSREHILESAFAEFAGQGYAGGSINAICARGGISKGLLYHYYGDKDQLYLACVERCFQELTQYLAQELDPAAVTPEQYFDRRMDFFRANPHHQSLFRDTLISPPPQLVQAIRRCRAGFDRLNDALLRAILAHERLADGLTVEDAVVQLRLFEDLLSAYLRAAAGQEPAVEQYDQLCRRTLRTMLYGLLAR